MVFIFRLAVVSLVVVVSVCLLVVLASSSLGLVAALGPVPRSLCPVSTSTGRRHRPCGAVSLGRQLRLPLKMDAVVLFFMTQYNYFSSDNARDDGEQPRELAQPKAAFGQRES